MMVNLKNQFKGYPFIAISNSIKSQDYVYVKVEYQGTT